MMAGTITWPPLRRTRESHSATAITSSLRCGCFRSPSGPESRKKDSAHEKSGCSPESERLSFIAFLNSATSRSALRIASGSLVASSAFHFCEKLQSGANRWSLTPPASESFRVWFCASSLSPFYVYPTNAHHNLKADFVSRTVIRHVRESCSAPSARLWYSAESRTSRPAKPSSFLSPKSPTRQGSTQGHDGSSTLGGPNRKKVALSSLKVLVRCSPVRYASTKASTKNVI